jgi:hypothetical protein
MAFNMKKPNVSVSYGGESKKQEKHNLNHDNPVPEHASALFQYGDSDSPVDLTKKGKKDLLANPEVKGNFREAIASENPVSMNKSDSVLYKAGCFSGGKSYKK